MSGKNEKFWKTTVVVSIISIVFSGLSWLFVSAVNYYEFKAKQEIINKMDNDRYKHTLNSIESRRSEVVDGLEDNKKMIQSVMDSVRSMGAKVEDNSKKMDAVNNKVRFIFNNTKDLKKFSDFFLVDQ